MRAACRRVAEGATHVRIDAARVPGYVAALPLDQATAPALDPEHHYLDEPEGALAFVLSLDAINFGSGYFPHLVKRPGLSGYFTIASRWTDRFRTGGVPTAAELAELTAADCSRIFAQPTDGGPVGELMALFARALNDLGRLVSERFDGRFAGLVEAAGGSAERLVALLAELPLYRDVRDYRGFAVPFYKRAQLTAADLSLAFGGAGWGRFDDLDRLTIFADNLVPHVLRLDGVLDYAPELAARIDRAEPIPEGAEEEVELRACALHAVELMVAEAARRGPPVTAMQLDYLLWNRGQAPDYKRARPRHRTRTVAY